MPGCLRRLRPDQAASSFTMLHERTESRDGPRSVLGGRPGSWWVRIGNSGSAGQFVVGSRRKRGCCQGKSRFGAGKRDRDGHARRLGTDRGLCSRLGLRASLTIGTSRCRSMAGAAERPKQTGRSGRVQRRAQQQCQDRQKTAEAAENRHAATMRVGTQKASATPVAPSPGDQAGAWRRSSWRPAMLRPGTPEATWRLPIPIRPHRAHSRGSGTGDRPDM